MAWISTPAYSIMVKSLACISAGGCIIGVPLGAVYGFGVGNNSLTVEEKKELILKDISSKGCHVTAEGVQGKSKFGAIYTCPVGRSASEEGSEDMVSGAEALYYLEEESSFDSLDSSKSPMSLFKKVLGLQYKKEDDSKDYLFLDLGEGVKKQVSVESSDHWQLFGAIPLTK